MLTRRTLLTAGATAAIPFSLSYARAATPAGIIVMAKAIDDVISFDHVQAYEFSDIEVDADLYRKLVVPSLHDLRKIDPDVAAAWEVSSDGRVLTFHIGQHGAFAPIKKTPVREAIK